MANAPLQLDGFRLLLCDLDGSRDGFEYVRAYGRHQAQGLCSEAFGAFC